MGVTAVLVLSVLAMFTAGARAEGEYPVITKWGSSGTGGGQFNSPSGIAEDSSGNVSVADSWNDRIPKFAPGIPEEPSLTFSPSSHDFGDMHEGDMDSTTFEIRNSGTGTLTYASGTSTVTVNVVPCPESSWTFMVYLAGDNNLEGAGIDDFLEMSSVGSSSAVNIVVQFDRIPGYDDSYGDWTSCKRFM